MLKSLPDESVHCVVTSPPYWALRDYGADGQLGLEPTPDEYITNMVTIFREVRRVLRKDGTLWLNMGDSYAGNKDGNTEIIKNPRVVTSSFKKRCPHNLKPKDLCGMPWRLAFALQADGWWLRSDVIERVEIYCPRCGWQLEERIWRYSQDREIIWSKPNPMPESVTDRPTKSHEYVFLLTKAAKYFYDANAIRELHKPESIERTKHSWDGNRERSSTQNPQTPDMKKMCHINGRNARSVWEIPTQAFAEAHFACVDDETECLTNRGWKKYNEIDTGDIAAQFHLDSELISWGIIEDVKVYNVENQEMVCGKRRDMDMILTPNHRCVIHRRYPRTRELQPPVIIYADELKPSHHIPTAGNWDIDGSQYGQPKDMAELMGWYISEGYECKNTTAVEIYQSLSVNPQKVKRIRQLLDTLGAEYSESICKAMYNGETRQCVAFRIVGYIAHELRRLCPDKTVRPDLLDWPTQSLNAFMDGMIEGDGCTRKDGRKSFVQKDKQVADMVQAIAIRIGWAATLSKRTNGIHVVYFTTHHTRSFRGTAGVGSQLDRVKYTGRVWCPKLPAGTWVARRNGRVFITGNTFPEELARRCIKAGTSEKGCCPECGKPWVRIIEKTGHKNMREPAHAPNNCPTKTDSTNWKPTSTPTNIWRPGCECFQYIKQEKVTSGEKRGIVSPEPIPCTVMDPFSGAGTTGLVADQLGQNAILIELKPEYAEMAENRIRNECPMFVEINVNQEKRV